VVILKLSKIFLLIPGLLFLFIATFYGFASALDYTKILRISLIADCVAIIIFGIIIRKSEKNLKLFSLLLLIWAFFVAYQAIHRLMI
jgi:hypothetical protein